LHKVTTATVDHHQMRSTILENPKTMEVYVGRLRTLEICRIKVINLKLIKVCKEGYNLTHRIWNYGRTIANLKLRRDSRERT